MLNLNGIRCITDAGLAHLKELTQLQVLIINGTNVSDAGLVHLQRMTQLRVLDMVYTHVTYGGVQRLRMSLSPTCRIDHSERYDPSWKQSAAKP